MHIRGRLALGGVAAAVALSFAGSRMPAVLHADPLVAEAGDSTTALSRAFRTASQRAQPSLVHVKVKRTTGRAAVQIPDGFEGTPFEDFFERMQRSDPRSAPQSASGSGFVFRKDGYILTNNHVAQNGDEIVVVLHDGRELAAKLVGRDPNTDLAVLKVTAENLPVAVIGDADRMEVGDWVVALGYPLALGPTVTAGIISAKGRSLGIIGQNREAQAPLEHFIQTDAAINPGNSGGPLVDLNGRVIGINTAIASPTGYYSGYGFAVPINLAMRVAQDLIQFGEVHRPKLGVAVADVDPVDAEVYKLPNANGAEITQVTPDSPAEKAGLKLGDVVTHLNGTPIKNAGALTEQLARLKPGDTVVLGVHRYGSKLDAKVKLGVFASAAPAAEPRRDPARTGTARLGFTAAETERGVTIADVTPGSAAARAGLARGMVLERLNGTAIRQMDELERAIESIRAGGVVSVVVRDGQGARTIINFRAPQ